MFSVSPMKEASHKKACMVAFEKYKKKMDQVKTLF